MPNRFQAIAAGRVYGFALNPQQATSGAKNPSGRQRRRHRIPDRAHPGLRGARAFLIHLFSLIGLLRKSSRPPKLTEALHYAEGGEHGLKAPFHNRDMARRRGYIHYGVRLQQTH